MQKHHWAPPAGRHRHRLAGGRPGRRGPYRRATFITDDTRGSALSTLAMSALLGVSFLALGWVAHRESARFTTARRPARLARPILTYGLFFLGGGFLTMYPSADLLRGGPGLTGDPGVRAGRLFGAHGRLLRRPRDRFRGRRSQPDRNRGRGPRSDGPGDPADDPARLVAPSVAAPSTRRWWSLLEVPDRGAREPDRPAGEPRSGGVADLGDLRNLLGHRCARSPPRARIDVPRWPRNIGVGPAARQREHHREGHHV